MIISPYNYFILKPSNSKRMKNLVKIAFSLVAFLCFSQVTFAQTVNQGAWMLGGSAGFRSDNPKPDDGETNTTIEFSPNIGYFIADDLGIGLSLRFKSQSAEDGIPDNSTSEFAIGPFVRYYFVDGIFGQLGVNLGLSDDDNTVDFDESFTEIELGIGYSWFVDNSVAIEPKLFYRLNNVKGSTTIEDLGDYNTIGLSIGVQGFAGRVGVE